MFVAIGSAITPLWRDWTTLCDADDANDFRECEDYCADEPETEFFFVPDAEYDFQEHRVFCDFESASVTRMTQKRGRLAQIYSQALNDCLLAHIMLRKVFNNGRKQ